MVRVRPLNLQKKKIQKGFKIACEWKQMCVYVMQYENRELIHFIPMVHTHTCTIYSFFFISKYRIYTASGRICAIATTIIAIGGYAHSTLENKVLCFVYILWKETCCDSFFRFLPIICKRMQIMNVAKKVIWCVSSSLPQIEYSLGLLFA